MSEIDRIRSQANTVPVNIEAIIRGLGIEVRKDADLPPNISGQIKRIGDRYEISSAKGEHYYRQRFSLAHELGHYVLHRSLIGQGVDDNKKYRSTAEGDFYNTFIELDHERQANSFAASILIPENLLKEKLNDLTRYPMVELVPRLYKAFQVSRSAMEWRLKNTGLINHMRT
jgi:Zn-dependent peptidase ImmA (M78 family)